MGLLEKFFGKRRNKKLVVIGLDGVPYTFIKRLLDNGEMPVFKSLVAQGEFKRMNSVIPTISSVAWSSFLTGKDASGHNIFGFIDRKPDPFKLFIPTARNRKAAPFWHELGEMGKRSVVINIPVTYPPEEIKGIMISGFLATDLRKAVYPADIADELLDMGYVIDADTWIARDSKDRFMSELNNALERRFKTAFKLLKEKEWDYFHCHIMETDRINHFYWADMEDGHPVYEEAFYCFYRDIDTFLGQLLLSLDDDTGLMILSDHGFCKIKKEVQLNYWLQEEGYLKYSTAEPESIKDMAGTSKAYSLLPGRIYINRQGREEKGSVKAGEYFSLREELKEKLLDLKDEETGEKIIQEVYFREEVYDGPYLEQAADLIAVPVDGYDLKAHVDCKQLLAKGFIQGMHTYDDAFIYMKESNRSNLAQVDSIIDVKDVIIDYFKG